MKIEKIKIRKIKEPLFLAQGDLIFDKQRKCEITIIRLSNTFSGFDVIFHDFEIIGALPFSVIKEFCYYIC